MAYTRINDFLYTDDEGLKVVFDENDDDRVDIVDMLLDPAERKIIEHQLGASTDGPPDWSGIGYFEVGLRFEHLLHDELLYVPRAIGEHGVESEIIAWLKGTCLDRWEIKLWQGRYRAFFASANDAFHFLMRWL